MNNNSGIYIRSMDGGAPALFAEPDEQGVAMSPKWSPDGKWIAFLRSGTIRGAALFVKRPGRREEHFLGIVCNYQETWSGDGRSVIASSPKNSTPNEECRMTVYPIHAGKDSQQLEISGKFPVISPDGKTLAFVHHNEIRLLGLGLDGRPAGPARTLVREPSEIANPLWVPGGREILYLLLEDRSRIRRVEARPGSTPHASNSIDGNFASFAISPRGEILGVVEIHDDSYWRIDLRAPSPVPEIVRRLAWNARHLKIAPDGKTLAYVTSERGTSEVYLSKRDGSEPRRLVQIMYGEIEQLDWSPDGQRIALTARPGFSQIEPSYLLVASTADGSLQRLLKGSDAVYQATWSRDGEALYYVMAESNGDNSVWKLKLTGQSVTRVTQGSAQQLQESLDGRFLYIIRNSSELLRGSVDGTALEYVARDVLRMTVGANELYFERQDSKPPVATGLNLYRLDLTTHVLRLVANIGFLASTMQLSSDARFIYLERHEARRGQLMLVQDWH